MFAIFITVRNSFIFLFLFEIDNKSVYEYYKHYEFVQPKIKREGGLDSAIL